MHDGLLRIQLDDEMFFDVEVHIFTDRHSEHLARKLFSVELKPGRNRNERSICTGQLFEQHGRAAALFDSDDLTGFHLIRGNIALLTVNGMIASDYLLLPVQTEFYALEGVAQLLESMKLVMKQANPKLRLLGVVATMYDKRTSLSSQVLAEIKKYFKDLTFRTTIPRNVRLAEAPSHGVPVGAYDKFSKGAKAYKEFTKEVEERINGK